MKRSATIALTLCMAFMVAGPIAAKNITADQLAAFKPGTSTYQDVVKALGDPQSVTIQSDGSRTITYGTTKMHVKAITFVPIVGMFAGGDVGTNSVATFAFSRDGVLLYSGSSTSKVDCTSHLIGVACQGFAPAPVLAPAQMAAPQAAIAAAEPEAAPAAAAQATAPAASLPSPTAPPIRRSRKAGCIRLPTDPSQNTC